MMVCKQNKRLGCALVLAALTGCGGGASSTVTETTPTATKLASASAPSGFGFSNYDSYVGLSSSTLLSKVPTFVVYDAKRTYVDVWYINEDGVRQQVFFGTVQTLRTTDERGGLSVRVPSNVPTLHYQIYDAHQTSAEVQV